MPCKSLMVMFFKKNLNTEKSGREAGVSGLGRGGQGWASQLGYDHHRSWPITMEYAVHTMAFENNRTSWPVAFYFLFFFLIIIYFIVLGNIGHFRQTYIVLVLVMEPIFSRSNLSYASTFHAPRLNIVIGRC